MNLEIKDPDKKNIFTKVLKYLTQFTEVVSISCGKEGDEDRLYIQGMDSAHVSLFELHLLSSWFDVFEVPTQVIIGLDIKLLAGILCFRDKEQNIKLELDYDGDKLYIGLISEDTLNKEFEIPLIDLDEERLSIPNVEYPADFVIESKKFKELVDQMSFFGNEIIFDCDEEHIKMFSKGDNGQMKVNISFDDVDEYAIEEEKKLKLKFSSGYIQWMTEYASFIEKTHVYLSDTVPMQIYYSLDEDDDTSMKNYIRFYLAPMIDDY
jgi:proliferating cell nuclear antigen PCNA